MYPTVKRVYLEISVKSKGAGGTLSPSQVWDVRDYLAQTPARRPNVAFCSVLGGWEGYEKQCSVMEKIQGNKNESSLAAGNTRSSLKGMRVSSCILGGRKGSKGK